MSKQRVVAMVRPVDGLGRVVIPISYRRELGLGPHDSVEIIPQQGGLLIRPYRPSCPCGATENLVEIGSERRCRSCLRRLLDEDGANGEAVD